jgi:hypothetical protein
MTVPNAGDHRRAPQNIGADIADILLVAVVPPRYVTACLKLPSIASLNRADDISPS